MRLLNTTTIPTPHSPTTQSEIRRRLKGHTLTVELLAEEAWVILALVSRVSGHTYNAPREHASNIHDILAPALCKIVGAESRYQLTSTVNSCLSGDVQAYPYENP